MPDFIIPAIWILICLLVIMRLPFFRLSGIGKYWIPVIFIVHILAGFANYYIWASLIGHGDSLRYMHDSQLVYDQLYAHPLWFFELVTRTSLENVPQHLLSVQHSLYIEWHVPEYNMVRIYAVLNIFSFGNPWGNIVLLGFLLFTVLILLFKRLDATFSIHPVLMFVLLFAIPSLFFWTNGLLKEGPALMAMVLICIQLIRLERSFNPFTVLWLLLSGWLAFLVRDYLLYLLIPACIVYPLSIRMHQKPIYIYIAASVIGISALLIFSVLQPADAPFKKLQEEQSYFFLSPPDPEYHFDTLSGTTEDALRKIPYAINNVLFRPNILHSHSAFRIYQSAEMFICILFLVYAFLFRDRHVRLTSAICCMLFISIALLMVYGLIVPDADTLSRYRTVPLFFLLMTGGILIGNRKTIRE